MSAPAGWYRDPYRPSGSRHWDGQAWTDHVSHGGSVSADPIGTAPQLPAPIVTTPAPLSAESVQKARRAELVRRWVIAAVVIAVGVFGSAVLLQIQLAR